MEHLSVEMCGLNVNTHKNHDTYSSSLTNEYIESNGYKKGIY